MWKVPVRPAHSQCSFLSAAVRCKVKLRVEVIWDRFCRAEVMG